MPTQQDMYDRIADELQRDDLSSQTTLAVTQAVAYYQRNPFYLSDKVSTAPTVANTQVYTFPTDVAWFRAVYITVNGTRYPMRDVTFEYLEREDANQANPTKGPPEDYSIFGPQIYLFPTPDVSSYTITYDYVQLIPQPTGPTDSISFWVTDAEAVIRNRAKGILFSEVLNQMDLAQICFARADDEHEKLQEITVMRKFSGSRRAWDV